MKTITQLFEDSENIYVGNLASINSPNPHDEVTNKDLWEIAERVIPRDAVKMVNYLYNSDSEFSNGYLQIEDWKHFHQIMPSPKPNLISPFDLCCYLARQFLVSSLKQRRNLGEALWHEKMKNELSPEDFEKMPFYFYSPVDEPDFDEPYSE